METIADIVDAVRKNRYNMLGTTYHQQKALYKTLPQKTKAHKSYWLDFL